MRFRIRGPSGNSTVSLDDSATVEALSKLIETETSLSSFEVKYGYPPRTLDLGALPPTTPLLELNVKLNGEQLLVHEVKSTQTGNETSRASNPAQNPARAAAAPSTHTRPSKPTQTTSTPQKSSSAPLSLSRKKNPEMDDPPEIYCSDLQGTLVLRIMPDDNSCLFRAVASAVLGDLDAVTELRSVVAQYIQSNPDKYTKVVLDNKEPDAYCRWIQSEDAWGGQIELDILSQHFGVEICSIDVQTLRADKYNETAPSRCFIVYSGIHYDTIAFSVEPRMPEFDEKVFTSPVADQVLSHAISLCRKLQEKHYFTDTGGFQLRCNDCGANLTGEAGAMKHATETGHTNFGEAS
jgi:ubiquitin thioesterase OTU1